MLYYVNDVSMCLLLILENYRNQTAKMMSAINFIGEYCMESRLAVRIDDDVIFHPTNMITSIIRLINQDNENTYNASEKYHANVLGDQEQRDDNSTTKQAPSMQYEDLHHYREVEKSSKQLSSPTLLPQYDRPHHPGYSYYSLRPIDAAGRHRKELEGLHNNTVVCHILHHKIAREHIDYKLDRKYLPDELWFPEYCAGFFIAITIDLMPEFRRMFHLEPPFWIDDAYLGVIQKRLLTINKPANTRLKFDPPKRRNIRSELTRVSNLAPIVFHLNQHQFFKRLGEIRLLTEW